MNKIALSSNDYKRKQSVDLIETYAYGTRKDLLSEREEIKCNIIMKRCKKWLTLMMLWKKTNEPNLKWLQIPDHLYRILIIGCSGSGKANSLFNLISQQPEIDKVYLYAKDTYEAKYQFLINKRETTGLKHLYDSISFIEYSNDMDDIYKNIEEYNPNKKRKILIVFDDMIAVMLSNEKLNLILTERFIRGRKLNISLVFIS